ncbi:LysM domain-containing protein [Actinokineospora auranticolor]|uniref:LysM domain-containing protein n=1 Tax=Actinokineospora auranticolor TaxID=155976 RepID=A0A2S6GC92_9PSEU|nr:LysM peptidoglycan-binding domain-containing protein [Actinokineospora auranticolor]PPK62221.1 LysM domain-containing protein [Actinokineospora auranticolor]
MATSVQVVRRGSDLGERVEGRSPAATAPIRPAPSPLRRARRHRPPNRGRVAGAARVVAAPGCGPRRSPIPVSVLAGVAAVVAIAVYGLGSAADSMAGASVPQETAVVRVKAGETLSDLAARMAPGSDVGAVVDRIRGLNGLEGSTIFPGQPLEVPVSR